MVKMVDAAREYGIHYLSILALVRKGLVRGEDRLVRSNGRTKGAAPML